MPLTFFCRLEHVLPIAFVAFFPIHTIMRCEKTDFAAAYDNDLNSHTGRSEIQHGHIISK